MPRQARTTAQTSVYHAILRGVNKQQVFEEEEDYMRFLSVLDRISFVELKALVDTPLPEEDSRQFIDIDVPCAKSTYTDEEIWQILFTLSGTGNATQFQALPRPEQKQHLFAAREEGIGPRTLSRLTGVPYSIVQRATSGTFLYGGIVREPFPDDEEYETYIDRSEYEKYPDY